VLANGSLGVAHKAVSRCRTEYCFSLCVLRSVFLSEQYAKSKMSAVSQGLLIQVVTPVL